MQVELNVDFLTSVIFSHSLGGTTSHSGFYNINCPACVLRGEKRPDRRKRCGIKISTDSVGINCFNCRLKARYRLGDRINSNMKQFISALGVSERQIQVLSYTADIIRKNIAESPEIQSKLNISISPDHPTIRLPISMKSLQEWAELGCDDPNFLNVVEYFFSRGDIVSNATTFYWSSDSAFNRRLIIPCYQGNRLVGWIGRAIYDDIKPKYYKELPNNFIFNSHVMYIPHRKYILVVEGVFDALSIDGIAILGATIGDGQISQIVQSGKQPVIVADRDKAGDHLINVALKYKWPVSIMNYGHNQWWDSDIKDVDEAARRYGKLYTIQSIFASMTRNETKIRQRVFYNRVEESKI